MGQCGYCEEWLKIDVVHHLPDAILIIAAIGVVGLILVVARFVGVYAIRRELIREKRRIRQSEYNERWGG